MITIQNNRLEIQCQEPGSQYTRPRFDWSGIAQQITLDGEHTYLSQEAHGSYRGTEGIGLSDEFGLVTPVGYTETPVNGWFPKIGVGFLQRESSEPYTFEKDYQIQLVAINVEQDQANRVIFSQKSDIFNGWAWKLQKTLSLEGAHLIVDYALENSGDRPIVTENYNHNFLAVNHHTVGPDYQLQTSFPLKLEDLLGPIAIDENMLTLTEIPEQYFYARQTDCANQQNVEWSLIHQPSGHGISVKEKYQLSAFAVWGMSYVISPEAFVRINLQPGDTQTWRREYHFF